MSVYYSFSNDFAYEAGLAKFIKVRAAIICVRGFPITVTSYSY